MKINSLKRWLSFVVAIFLCFLPPGLVKAQNISNYAFSTNATGTMEDLSVGATSLLTGNSDDFSTGFQEIGFPFTYMGVTYTHYSANSNGQFLFAGNDQSNQITAANTGTMPVANMPYLFLMSNDNECNEGMRSKVIGTAPNRIFILEWTSFYVNYINITNSGNMQLWLHEGTGVIEYKYGNIINSATSSQSRSIGLSSSNTSTTAGFITLSATPTFTASATAITNSFAANVAHPDLGGVAAGTHRVFRFQATGTTAASNLTFSSITGTTMTLNWQDNSSDEVGFNIYRSTDAVNYEFIETVAANTTSYNASILTPSTEYHWKVTAVREVESLPVLGSEFTLGASFAGGIKTVGAGGDFENLTTAFAHINTNGLLSDVQLQLIAGYPAAPETYPILSCNSGATNGYSVLVYPTVTGLSITSNDATGTLNLNNARNVVFDGRISLTGPIALDISNTGGGYAVQFINGASFDTLRYLAINSNNTSATSGTIKFAGSNSSTGNNYNTIESCTVGMTTTTPRFGIYSAGTSIAKSNTGNTIIYSSIFDYFSAVSNSAGIFVASNSTAWIIDGNRFYQTQSRAITTSSTHRGIHIVSATGTDFVVNNNVIGYNNEAGTGFSTYTGTGSRFVGIELTTSTTASANPTSVQGNIIGGLDISATTGTTSAPGVFSGIYNAAGKVNIGNINGNEIGVGEIKVKITTSSAGTVYGIYSTSVGDHIISNNTVKKINFNPTSTNASNITGIYATGGTDVIVSNNRIGGSTVDALVAATSGVTTISTTLTGIEVGPVTNLNMNGNNISHLMNNASGGTNYGIRSGTAVYALTNNVISDIAFTSIAGSSTSTIYGYYNVASPTSETLTDNSIFNLSVNGASSSTASIIAGICSNTTTSVKTISGNQIYGINYSNTGSGSANVHGILSLAGLDVKLFNNKISNLSANGTASVTTGISLNSLSSSGIATIYNNLLGNLYSTSVNSQDGVRGIAAAVSSSNSKVNVYNNTIYLNASSTGTNFGTSGITHSASTTATTGTLDLRNNIVINESTPRGTGVTAAIRRTLASLQNFSNSSNRNLLYAGVPDANHVICYNGTTPYSTFSTYQAAVLPREVNSFTGESSFITDGYGTAGNFFISLDGTSLDFLKPVNGIASLIESGADVITFPAITTDYSGVVRGGNAGYLGTGTAPDVGAFEVNGLQLTPVVSLLSVVPDLTAQCAAEPRVISVEVNTFGPAIVSATLTYTINQGSPVSLAMTNISGNIWEATIPAATPGNALISWGVVAQNTAGLNANLIGTSYSDNILLGAVQVIEVASDNICEGSSTNLETKVTKALNATIGSSVLTSDTGPSTTPFFGGYGGAKTQYLIKANELSAIGLFAGSDIQKLSMFVVSAGASIPDYTISMANTSVEFLTTNILDVPNVVFTTPSYTPTVGENIFNFSSPFIWDGVSNVVISFCYSANNLGFTTSTVQVSATPFVSGAARGIDNVSSATMCALIGTSASGTSGTTSLRPNFKLQGNILYPLSSIVWNDGVSDFSTSNTVSVTPSVTTTYTASAISLGCTVNPSVTQLITVNEIPTAPTAVNASHCGNQISTAHVVSTTTQVDPTFNWYTAATGGTPVQSSSSTSYQNAVATTTTFYVAEAIPVVGCESDRIPVTITVMPVDAITVTTAAEICFGESLNIEIVNASTNPTQSYTYSTVSTVGSGLETAANGAIIMATPTAPGSYTYEVTATDNGCLTTESVTVLVKNAPSNTVASASSAVVCEGNTVNLIASANPNVYSNGTLTEDFSATSLPSTWTFLNAGNGNPWTRGTTSTTGSGSLTYEYDPYNAANAWAFTPQLSMIAGQTYTISFKYKVGLGSYVERLKVTIGGQQTVAAQSTVLWNNNGQASLNNTAWMTATISYVPTTTGNFSVGFNCYSIANRYELYVDDVEIQYTAAGNVTYDWSSNPAGFTSNVQNPTNVIVNESTTYTVTATNSNGCAQTASVSVNTNPNTSSNTSITACDSYTWNGTTYNQSGTYTFTTQNSLGCDSIATLNLTIKQSTTATIAVQECVTYTWPLNGQTYTASGAYTHTIPNTAGCDSVITLDLTILEPTSSTINLASCETYTWPLNGQTYNATGLYSHTITNSAGCDSVVTLNLLVTQPTTSSVSVTECGSYTWALNGVTYYASEVVTFVGTNIAGCDSTVTLNLTINQPSASSISITNCGDYTWPLNGEVYAASGSYTHVIPNYVGCDSTVTLELTIINPSASTVTASNCDTYTWALNGQTYTTSGMYTHVIPNHVGCDSTVTLDLTIFNSTTSTVVESACITYTWPLNGEVYIASGSYTHVIPNAVGCDSTVTLTLTITQPSTSTVSITECDSYTWPLNGQTYTTSGTHTHVIPNAAGCDSTVTLNLTISTLTATATYGSNGTITASAGSTYQWINCDTNAEIVGATSQTYTAMENGSYAVIVSNGVCSETSNCVVVGDLSIKGGNTVSIGLFPNPTNGVVNISMTAAEAVIEVIDNNGKVLYTKTVVSGDKIDLSSYERGVYSIKMMTDNGTVVERVVKN